MSHTIAALSNIHLLPDTLDAIQNLSNTPVAFPNDETQPSLDQLILRTGTADIVLVSPGTKLPKAYFDACPSVAYVCLCGTSTAHIDLDTMHARGIVFTNVVDYGDEPTAEFICMQLTILARGIGTYQWRDMPCELMGKSIGIVGFGALGKAVAHLALAYKMRVRYHSLHRKPEWEEKGVHYATLGDLLARSEIIILSGPTDTQLLGPKEFARLRSGSILVQASLGNVFDRAAFLHWIAQGSNYAVFDYAAGEDNYQAYKDLPHVIFPKIVAGHTVETRQRLGQRVVQNIEDYLKQTM